MKKQTKLFYRVANHTTQQGLWYDFKGNFAGFIHDRFNFCKNNKLPMPYDPSVVGWLSATETLDELFNWFPQEDIERLEKHGYTIALYEASEYKYHNNHWVIKQDSSRLVRCLSLACAKHAYIHPQKLRTYEISNHHKERPAVLNKLVRS